MSRSAITSFSISTYSLCAVVDLPGLLFLISTGGGAILRDKNQKIFTNGCVIYLKISLDAQYERIKNRSHRPLLENKDIKATLENLDKTRNPIYKKTSDIEVDVSYLSKEDVISSINDKLKIN